MFISINEKSRESSLITTLLFPIVIIAVPLILWQLKRIHTIKMLLKIILVLMPPLLLTMILVYYDRYLQNDRQITDCPCF